MPIACRSGTRRSALWYRVRERRSGRIAGVADDAWAGGGEPTSPAESGSNLADPSGPTRTESRVLVIGYFLALLAGCIVLNASKNYGHAGSSSASPEFFVTLAVLLWLALFMEVIRVRVVRRHGGRPWRSGARATHRFAMSAVKNTEWPRFPLLSALGVGTLVYVLLLVVPTLRTLIP